MPVSKRKCKLCGEYRSASDGVKTPAGFFCCHDHAIQFAMEKSAKQRERQAAKARRESEAKAKEARKADRQRKMEVKPLSYWMKRAQSAVNKYIRVRDRDLPCISCGRHHQGQYHAGHYRSVAACSSRRFYTLNINKQCSVCNTHLSSNAIQYRSALIDKYGAEVVESIESDNRQVRYGVEYLKRVERVFTAKVKAIEKRVIYGQARF